MTQKVVKIIMVLLIILTLPGCYNYSEPDELAYVLALGLDRGRENVLTVTAVIAIPKNIAEGGGGGGKPASGGGGQGGFFTVSMDTPTLLGFQELINAVVDRRATLSHNTWFVFSRELAEQGIGEYFAPISRFHQFRRTTRLVVCEGRAEDFLARGQPVMEANVGKYYQLMQQGWKFTEFIPMENYNMFNLEAHLPGVAPVTMLAALGKGERIYPDNSPKPKGDYQAGRIPRRGGGEIEVMGAAVFLNGVMVGTLDADELGVRKMLNGTLKRTVLDVADPYHPGKYLVLEVMPRRAPDINVSIGADGYPRIEASLSLEGEIFSVQSGANYNTPEKLHIVEKAVEQRIMEDINDAMEKSKEMQADIAGFGLHAKKLFSTWSRWEAYKWDEKYPDAEIIINVDYRVRRTGLLHEMVPIR